MGADAPGTYLSSRPVVDGMDVAPGGGLVGGRWGDYRPVVGAYHPNPGMGDGREYSLGRGTVVRYWGHSTMVGAGQSCRPDGVGELVSGPPVPGVGTPAGHASGTGSVAPKGPARIPGRGVDQPSGGTGRPRLFGLR